MPAPVAQRIEQLRPKEKIEVQFLSGAPPYARTKNQMSHF